MLESSCIFDSVVILLYYVVALSAISRNACVSRTCTEGICSLALVSND